MLVAHHPQRFSNTYKFYLKGWRGINIDAMPEEYGTYSGKFRPGDINLENCDFKLSTAVDILHV